MGRGIRNAERSKAKRKEESKVKRSKKVKDSVTEKCSLVRNMLSGTEINRVPEEIVSEEDKLAHKLAVSTLKSGIGRVVFRMEQQINTEEYLVEKIVGLRLGAKPSSQAGGLSRHDLEFQVKWVGYEETTWEIYENVGYSVAFEEFWVRAASGSEGAIAKSLAQAKHIHSSE